MSDTASTAQGLSLRGMWLRPSAESAVGCLGFGPGPARDGGGTREQEQQPRGRHLDGRRFPAEAGSFRTTWQRRRADSGGGGVSLASCEFDLSRPADSARGVPRNPRAFCEAAPVRDTARHTALRNDIGLGVVPFNRSGKQARCTPSGSSLEGSCCSASSSYWGAGSAEEDPRRWPAPQVTSSRSVLHRGLRGPGCSCGQSFGGDSLEAR